LNLPADRENALGWSDVCKTGTKDECLAYIKEVWTDMRPLSLRKRMEESQAWRFRRNALLNKSEGL
jgi:MbtH protein